MGKVTFKQRLKVGGQGGNPAPGRGERTPLAVVTHASDSSVLDSGTPYASLAPWPGKGGLCSVSSLGSCP